MYLDYFKLTHKPFSLTPDPAFLFLSSTHREALGHMLYGLRERSGFIALIGEVGTGKTTLLRALLAQLPEEEYRTAFIFNPRVSSLELLRGIMREFALDVQGAGRDEMLNALNGYLLEQNAAGRTVVLVIDEAQNLGATALEEVRLLSNLETETDKLLQIVLVGQPELARTLEDRKLRQLRQRISIFYRLQPLSPRECLAYARHRIEVAGCDPERLFTPSALRRACRSCLGIPRKLNVLLDRALLTAYTQEARQVSRRHLNSARRDLNPPLRLRPARLLSWGGLLAVLLAGGLLVRGYAPATQVAGAPAATVAQPASAPALAPSISTSTIHPLALYLSAMSSRDSRNQSLAALMQRWGRAPLSSDTSAPLVQAVSSRDLQLYRFRGTLDELLALNSPALLPVQLPGVEGPRFLALLTSRDGLFRIVPSPSDETFVSRALLESFWNGEAWVPWANPAGVAKVLQLGDRSAAVSEVQKRLLGAGFFAGIFNGEFDRETLDAVTAFQHDAGLPTDGRVGPQTLICLYQAGGMESPATLRPRQGAE